MIINKSDHWNGAIYIIHVFVQLRAFITNLPEPYTKCMKYPQNSWRLRLISGRVYTSPS